MTKGDDIQERLIDLAVSNVKFTTKLPKSSIGRHVSGQLLRSGTSPAPNYAEARSAESSKDFIHKLKISLKELNETAVWLQIIIRSKMIPDEECMDLQKECDELCKIISASVRTSKKRRKKNNN
jgi:four helix bundle protein